VRSPPGVVLDGRFVRCTEEIPQCMGEAALQRCTCTRWTREQLREAELCSWRGHDRIRSRGELERAMCQDGEDPRHAWRVAWGRPNPRRALLRHGQVRR